MNLPSRNPLLIVTPAMKRVFHNDESKGGIQK